MRYIISLLLMIGCISPASARDLYIVTDIAPVYGMVASVMGDLGQVDLLLDQGSNAHDFQLRPRQAGALAKADAVIWIGPEMTPWLEHAVQNMGKDQADLRLLSLPKTFLREFEEDHDAHEGDAHEEHGEHDPHAWLNPQNGVLWLGAIADHLAGLDPENAPIYQQNAQAAIKRLQDQDAQIKALLTPLKDRPFIVFHDAYGYFVGHYGLNNIGAIAYGDAAPAGAAHLRELQEKAGGQKLCLFPEPGHDPKMPAQLAQAVGGVMGKPLDPEGVGAAPNADIYNNILADMAQNIADCLKEI